MLLFLSTIPLWNQFPGQAGMFTHFSLIKVKQINDFSLVYCLFSFLKTIKKGVC